MSCLALPCLALQVYKDNLPGAEQYEKSFMHRDIVTHIAVAKQTDYIITGSADGHVKFWKKMLTEIEFVKHFQVLIVFFWYY
jgi:peptidylprolyl isomerase domain and WD repeat-containing protein 1